MLGLKRKTYMHLLLVACIACCVGTTGCATSSVFKSYTSQANKVIANVQNGNFDAALTDLEKNVNGKDKILYLMERGRVAQLARKTDVSMTDFEKAIEAIRIQEDKAKISLGDTGATIGSIALNDNAIPYKGYGYEKVFVYQFQAMNYLAKGDLEGAGVEIRRANSQQEWEAELHHKELEKIEKAKEEQGDKKGYDDEKMQGSIDESYRDMFAEASKVKNSFQNAYSYYITGLIYELRNEPNDAFIDYKRAIEIYPDNPYLQKDVIRLAKQLKFQEDFDTYSNLFPESAEELKIEEGEDLGEVIVLYENGFVPQKKEIWIPLPLYRGIVKTNFPIYGSDRGPGSNLDVLVNGRSLGRTAVICNVRDLAIKSLYEQLPGIIFREIARVVSKTLLQKTASDNAGILGSILASGYNIATSRADLRAWYTLPNDVQILRASIPSGETPLTLQRGVGALPMQISVNVEAGKQTVVRVVDVGSSCFADAYTF